MGNETSQSWQGVLTQALSTGTVLIRCDATCCSTQSAMEQRDVLLTRRLQLDSCYPCTWKHRMYFLLCPGDASGLNSEVNGLKKKFKRKREKWTTRNNLMARSGVFFSSWLVRDNPCERPLQIVNSVSLNSMSPWASSPHKTYGSPEMGLIFTSICPLQSSEDGKKRKKKKSHPTHPGCSFHRGTKLGCHYLRILTARCKNNGKMGLEQR